MISFISQETYEAICKQWVHTLLLNAESQVHVWPPLSCSYAVLYKFSQDKGLQEKLFDNRKHTLIYIDGYEATKPDWNEFENQFFHSIGEYHDSDLDMDRYITQHPDTIFGIFLVGYDNAIKHSNTSLLKHIGTLLEKHENMSVILLTEQNIADSPSYVDLIQKHMIVENISYQELYEPTDMHAILEHLEHSWEFTIPQDTKEHLISTIGGHPMLLEEAARIIRDHPHASTEDILSHPHLLRKAVTIFKSLHENDQEVIRSVLEGNKHNGSEYLQETGIMKNGTLQLPYWKYIYENFPEENVFHHTKHPAIDVTHFLTRKEHDIFEHLEKNPGNVFSREQVAQLIWGDTWEDKYSDWAIDQTMHRLREKLSQYHNSYSIKTKKGEGFVLLQAQ
jgi:hypothetical protein